MNHTKPSTVREPIIFTELGGCDDEHLRRVEPRKGDVVRRRINWFAVLVYGGCVVFWSVILDWLF